MTASQHLLETENLSIGYHPPRKPARVVAAHLNLHLKHGELVCLIGANGAGKSTLMRTLCGLQHPLDGKVIVRGENVHALPMERIATHLSIVLTERAPLGAVDGYTLVSLGRTPHLAWHGRRTEADEARIRWALDAVNAWHLADRLVDEVSDGERQKLFIARALAQDTPLMLLDEPTAFLDLPRRVEIMRLLRRLAHDSGRAVLLSTHDLDLALRSADRLWIIAAGGHIQCGAPEDLVLNGAFERAFHTEGVEFDAASGTFRLDRPRGAEIAVIGSGLRAEWLRRALVRVGYTPTAAGSLRVVVTDEVYRLELPDVVMECEQIETMIAALSQSGL